MKDQNFSKKIWREKLTSEEFSVCWEKGTEPAFSGKFNNEKAIGIYVCRCCRESLFYSDKKKRIMSQNGYSQAPDRS